MRDVEGMRQTMREIEYRGRAYDTKEDKTGDWVYGFYCAEPVRGKDNCLNVRPFIREICGDCYRDIWIEPKTLGEYANLKDKNGRKVYVGDIVKIQEKQTCIRPPYNQIVLVVFRRGYFIGEFNDGSECDYVFLVGRHESECEVIGNIHDNPELLEERI